MSVGIDLWKAEDQSDNRPEETLRNARLEGMADRIEVQTSATYVSLVEHPARMPCGTRLAAAVTNSSTGLPDQRAAGKCGPLVPLAAGI